MRGLSDDAMIELWERGSTRGPLDRGLLLLAAAAPEWPTATLADTPLAARDARVLALRTAMFGSRFNGITECPGCDSPLEFGFDLAGLDADSAACETVTDSGLRLRLPNSRDLAAATGGFSAAFAEADAASRALLRRCCLNEPDEVDWSLALYAEAQASLEILGERLGQALEFRCEDCGRTWTTPLDICDWLWREIEQGARGLLDEVHSLASRYHWSERDILAMGSQRRAAYLSRCGA